MKFYFFYNAFQVTTHAIVTPTAHPSNVGQQRHPILTISLSKESYIKELLESLERKAILHGRNIINNGLPVSVPSIAKYIMAAEQNHHLHWYYANQESWHTGRDQVNTQSSAISYESPLGE